MSKDKNKELMLACGSKKGQYDIEAPDQWKWVLLNAKDPEEQAMAWVKSKTTAFGHETPFCTDEHGRVLYIQHAAVELGWKEQTARNVFCRLDAQARIRLEKGKRIWYCAEVPQSKQARNGTSVGEESGPDEGDSPLEEGGDEEGPSRSKRNNSVQSYWAPYVIDFIKKLPKEKRAAAKAKIEAYPKWRREFMADGEAALRSIADRIEDTTLREIGVQKKRLPKRREEKRKWVQLGLLTQPEFVQSYSPESVQIPNGTSYQPKNGSVHSHTSFMSSTSTSTGKSAGRSLSVDRPTDQSLRGPDDAEQVHDFLIDELASLRPGETPGRSLCLQVAAAVGPMPLEELKPVFRRKEEKIREMGFGLVISLAKEVRIRWNRETSNRAKDSDRLELEEEIRNRAFAAEVLKSPDADIEQRDWANSILNNGRQKGAHA